MDHFPVRKLLRSAHEHRFLCWWTSPKMLLSRKTYPNHILRCERNGMIQNPHMPWNCLPDEPRWKEQFSRDRSLKSRKCVIKSNEILEIQRWWTFALDKSWLVVQVCPPNIGSPDWLGWIPWTPIVTTEMHWTVHPLSQFSQRFFISPKKCHGFSK
jgi:hypothetical protein